MVCLNKGIQDKTLQFELIKRQGNGWSWKKGSIRHKTKFEQKNVLIDKFSDVLIDKFSDVLIDKFSDVLIDKFSDVLIDKFSDEVRRYRKRDDAKWGRDVKRSALGLRLRLCPSLNLRTDSIKFY
jgi:hypothetical protein